MLMHTSDRPRKFRVAFSFAGEQRDLVRNVACAVRNELGPDTVFLDEWFEAYLAGHDADLKLQTIFGEQSDLVVVCVSAEYGHKSWTRAEHEIIRARINEARSSPEEIDHLRILLIRVGEGDVPGIPSETAIVPDVRRRSAAKIAEMILDRLHLISEDSIVTHERVRPASRVRRIATIVVLALIVVVAAVYHWVSRQPAGHDIVLLTNTIATQPTHMSIGVSIVNPTSRRFTLKDIRLLALVHEDFGTPTWRRDRIDLGVFSMLNGRRQQATSLVAPSASLLTERSVVVLEPRSSDSFFFTIEKPDAPAHLHLIFTLATDYFDDDGRADIAYADRIFDIEASDLLGLRSRGNLRFGPNTIASLRQQYGDRFHLEEHAP